MGLKVGKKTLINIYMFISKIKNS